MKEMPFLNAPTVFIEIGLDSLKIVRGAHGLELPLERTHDGKLSPGCRGTLMAELRKFLGRKSWLPHGRAVCGVSAQGVSLRRVALPAAAVNGLEDVIRLQIEKEFPLSPDDLAWGWREIAGDRREAVVVAVRKAALEEYAEIFSVAGLDPEFTVAAFGRELLCRASDEPHGILEVGQNRVELAWFDKGVPAGLRILPLGPTLTEAILKGVAGGVLYLSGRELSAELVSKLSGQVECRRLEFAGGEGFSSATAGLEKSAVEKTPLLWLRTKARPTRVSFDWSRAETRRWAVRAGVLLAILLILPFAEALLVKPFLNGKLTRFKAQKQQFVSVVDPEMRFLQDYKQNQPPYLDLFYLFSKTAQPGMRLDSLTVNQHGNIALKATMPSAQAVMDFRSKLIDSGFFANITVEEQTPMQFQPTVNVRMTAQWKPAAARPAVKLEPAPNPTAAPGLAMAAGGPLKPATP